MSIPRHAARKLVVTNSGIFTLERCKITPGKSHIIVLSPDHPQNCDCEGCTTFHQIELLRIDGWEVVQFDKDLATNIGGD